MTPTSLQANATLSPLTAMFCIQLFLSIHYFCMRQLSNLSPCNRTSDERFRIYWITEDRAMGTTENNAGFLQKIAFACTFLITEDRQK